MAIGYAHTLFCDRVGCRAKKTIENTMSAAHARQLARRDHGWRSDTAGDWCPGDGAARATAPSLAHTDTTARDTSHATHPEGPSQ
ncbi:hypothetical protein KMT30_05830 [Streptomyces sp. IBSBF 2953]|nr:hypothetical protein [Streptomyces hayashii]MCQ9178556.1 hypothetical protein [Streptomyces hayashii]